MLECRNLSLRLNEQTIISRLNFRISSGEKILLKGPSGSGKTSILHLIMGFIPPTDGELIWKLADYNKLNINGIIDKCYEVNGGVKRSNIPFL